MKFKKSGFANGVRRLAVTAAVCGVLSGCIGVPSSRCQPKAPRRTNRKDDRTVRLAFMALGGCGAGRGRAWQQRRAATRPDCGGSRRVAPGSSPRGRSLRHHRHTRNRCSYGHLCKFFHLIYSLKPVEDLIASADNPAPAQSIKHASCQHSDSSIKSTVYAES